MNYFSSVKLWVTANNPTDLAFKSHEVKLMKRAIFRKSTHVPRQAPPMTPRAVYGYDWFLVHADLNPSCINCVLNLFLHFPKAK